MKQIILFFIIGIQFWMTATASAMPEIFISSYPVDNDILTEESSRQLDLKLRQLLTQNGISDDDPNCRFAIVVKPSIITKDIVPGPPNKVSMNIDFTFIVGDTEEKKEFASATIPTIGVGANENKAFIAAIKAIKIRNPELLTLLKDAKNKIVLYYSQKCNQIKMEAEREAAMQNYERAIYLLTQIPDVCDCAYECQDLAIQYSNEYFNTRAKELINSAKSTWSASPNSDGASRAAEIISHIPANTDCQKELDNLISEINHKLKDDEKRDWDFKVKQYTDKVEKQKRDDQAKLEQQRANNVYRDKQQASDNAYRAIQQQADNTYRASQQQADNERRRIQQSADNAARSQAIEAARQIGITYAKNQPKSVSYKNVVNLWK